MRVYAWDGDNGVPLKHRSSDAKPLATLLCGTRAMLTNPGVEKVAGVTVDSSVILNGLLRGFIRQGVIHLWCDPWLRVTYSFATVQYTLNFSRQRLRQCAVRPRRLSLRILEALGSSFGADTTTITTSMSWTRAAMRALHITNDTKISAIEEGVRHVLSNDLSG